MPNNLSFGQFATRTAIAAKALDCFQLDGRLVRRSLQLFTRTQYSTTLFRTGRSTHANAINISLQSIRTQKSLTLPKACEEAQHQSVTASQIKYDETVSNNIPSKLTKSGDISALSRIANARLQPTNGHKHAPISTCELSKDNSNQSEPTSALGNIARARDAFRMGITKPMRDREWDLMRAKAQHTLDQVSKGEVQSAGGQEAILCNDEESEDEKESLDMGEGEWTGQER